jgi:hypothetical protein
MYITEHEHKRLLSQLFYAQPVTIQFHIIDRFVASAHMNAGEAALEGRGIAAKGERRTFYPGSYFKEPG